MHTKASKRGCTTTIHWRGEKQFPSHRTHTQRLMTQLPPYPPPKAHHPTPQPLTMTRTAANRCPSCCTLRILLPPHQPKFIGRFRCGILVAVPPKQGVGGVDKLYSAVTVGGLPEGGPAGLIVVFKVQALSIAAVPDVAAENVVIEMSKSMRLGSVALSSIGNGHHI